MQPLVSIICLCHNHQAFLGEAISSVLDQSYPNIEIIVVDDASTDGSKDLLKKITGEHKLPFVDLQENIGNCAAFNKGWALARGKYTIDFATDDVMFSHRIEKQVAFFKSLPEEYGVIYSNAIYIDAENNFLYDHFGNNALMDFQPRFEGDIYKHVLQEYFIPPPCMMFKNSVLKSLNGYDESLAYEDFDFWVRSSRNYRYGYQNECLTKIRKVRQSLSSKLYRKEDRQLLSTYKVCLKAAALNKSEEEDNSLKNRLRYEFKHAVLTENYKEADLFLKLIKQQGGINVATSFFEAIGKLNLPLTKLRNAYLRLRYGNR